MFSAKDTLAKVDPELWQAVQAEVQRQEDHIELIASENYVSKAVMEAQGSQLTNKYAEGYPGKRYYGGCEYVDVAEQTGDRSRQEALFGADCRQRATPLGLTGELQAVLHGAAATPVIRFIGQ